MPSDILRGMRHHPRVVIAIGAGHPGGDTGGPGQDAPPGGPGHDGGGEILQHAYDQVTEGLQVIAEHYPEAKGLLKDFESQWARWMASPHDGAKSTHDGASPDAAEESSEPSDNPKEEQDDTPPDKGY